MYVVKMLNVPIGFEERDWLTVSCTCINLHVGLFLQIGVSTGEKQTCNRDIVVRMSNLCHKTLIQIQRWLASFVVEKDTFK